MLAAALVTAGFVAGLAGAWSPCGFSVVETLGAASRRAVLVASVATFTLGALAGGVATFAGVAVLGSLAVGNPGWPAVGALAGVALVAAVAEARGIRIVPQVRRQVPERWRRALPLPLAAGAYGVLLGLGFTTFVLTFAFWGLTLALLVLADPELGLVVGLAFGVGRVLPVVALAPIATRRRGREVVDAMACRPGLLRGVRLAAAAALAAVAAGLLAAGASADVLARGATDPSVSRGVVAWEGVGGSFLRYEYRPGDPAHHLGPLISPLAGSDPAVGGSLLAWREGSLVRIVRLADFAPVLELQLPGVDALAISDRWLAYRVRAGGVDRIVARSLSPSGSERTVASARPPSALGRPSLDGDVLVYHLAAVRSSRLIAVRLPTGRTQVVRSSRAAQLTNPAVLGGSLLYVRQSSTRQELVVGALGRSRGDRVLLRMAPLARRDSGHEPGYSHRTRTPPARRPASGMLWTTALGARAAYVTVLSVRGGVRRSRIVRVAR